MSCQGADKTSEDGKIRFSENGEKFYVCLDTGVILHDDNGTISIKHLTNPNGSFSEIRLFTDNRKSYTQEEIIGASSEVINVSEKVETVKRGRKKGEF